MADKRADFDVFKAGLIAKNVAYIINNLDHAKGCQCEGEHSVMELSQVKQVFDVVG